MDLLFYLINKIVDDYLDPEENNRLIICGDFNSERFDISRELIISLDNKNIVLNDITMQMPRSPQIITVADWDGTLKRYDYMFYTRDNIEMLPGSAVIIPDDPNRLVRHELRFKEPYVYPDAGPYFSDHASLFARFRFR